MEPENSKVKVLGQEIPYPAKWTEVAGLGVLALAIVLISYIYFVEAKPHNLGAFTELTQRFFSPSGVLEETNYFRMIQFWTPSEKTQLAIPKNSITDRKWEIVDESKVREFDQMLYKLKVEGTIIGFRRYESYGAGRSGLKYGWWWIVTINKELKLEDFAKKYSDFWKNPESVYFEEIKLNEQHVQSGQ